MNPSELVKGCKKLTKPYSSIRCGQKFTGNPLIYYCEDCKMRMEQALFMVDYCFNTNLSDQGKDIEILEKALNIHTSETKVRILSKPERDASSVISGVSSSGRIPINNQGVKE